MERVAVFHRGGHLLPHLRGQPFQRGGIERCLDRRLHLLPDRADRVVGGKAPFQGEPLRLQRLEDRLDRDLAGGPSQPVAARGPRSASINPLRRSRLNSCSSDRAGMDCRLAMEAIVTGPVAWWTAKSTSALSA